MSQFFSLIAPLLVVGGFVSATVLPGLLFLNILPRRAARREAALSASTLQS